MFCIGSMFLCFAEGLCFYVLHRVYVLCFAEGLCSMFCKGSMRWTKKGSHHRHANAAITACICARVSSSWLKNPPDVKRMHMEGVNEVEEMEMI